MGNGEKKGKWGTVRGNKGGKRVWGRREDSDRRGEWLEGKREKGGRAKAYGTRERERRGQKCEGWQWTKGEVEGSAGRVQKKPQTKNKKAKTNSRVISAWPFNLRVGTQSGSYSRFQI